VRTSEEASDAAISAGAKTKCLTKVPRAANRLFLRGDTPTTNGLLEWDPTLLDSPAPRAAEDLESVPDLAEILEAPSTVKQARLVSLAVSAARNGPSTRARGKKVDKGKA
jgi:hypothetical protein